MAQIRVINNHTGDEGTVDETWLERWPDEFTPIDHDDSAPDPVLEDKPSDGTPDKEY